ncbi:MAG TPA: putative cytokinetic ring protein SteA [Solirubrobacteraceae bacterium]|nr:putative cytokinetic ring protein SteA [Solirubrobacteraceae bacterium]
MLEAVARPVIRRSQPRPLRGRARLGRRTKLLAKRLAPGDIAVIDHAGLDRVSAEDLIAARVRAVLNAGQSLSDSYPNIGPLLLVEAGVALIDLPDDSLFERCSDGELLDLTSDGEVRRDGELLALGRRLSAEELRAQTRTRHDQIDEALERFALNTIEHMREERELVGGRLELPPLETDFRDHVAFVVVRGGGYLDDLRALRSYIREVRPIIVAVDGAVDGLLDSGLRPDMIVGDMDSASDRALRCGAELIAHAYRDGRAPGRARLERLGLAHTVVPAPGTSEDVAMLIAAEKGASLIVSVGSQLNLVEFLDRDRKGASSSFLTRLRIGEILVDAKGVSRLQRRRPLPLPRAVVLAGLVATVAIVALTALGLGVTS